jgi:uncharacterized protein
MKVNVSRVLKGTDYEQEIEEMTNIPFIEFKGELIPVKSPVHVRVRITNTGERLLLNGTIKACVAMPCSRCLESFDYKVETDFTEELSNKDSGDDIVSFEGDTIDLTDIIINNILLSLPMKAICDLNCKGLCPNCGTNLNIKKCNCTGNDLDPRLAVLKGLLKDN